MVFPMKTTLDISDDVLHALEREAVRQRKTTGELVETALRGLLEQKPKEPELPPLPELSSGGAYVDVADRGLLYDVMGH